MGHSIRNQHKKVNFLTSLSQIVVKFGIPFHILKNGLMNFFQIFWATGVIIMGFQKCDLTARVAHQYFSISLTVSSIIKLEACKWTH